MPRDFSDLSLRQKRRILRKDIEKSRRTAILSDTDDQTAQPKIHKRRLKEELPVVEDEIAPVQSIPSRLAFAGADESDGSVNDQTLSSSSDNSGSINLNICESSSLFDDLRECFQNHHLSQRAINDFLAIFRKHRLIEIPQDARTFMGTPRYINNIIEMSGGKYIHFGLIENLKKIIKDYTDSEVVIGDNLKLNINVDGLPISKSSGSQFWPILGDLVVDNLITKPFLIGLFHSNGKPEDPNDFLRFFISEYKTIEGNGLMIEKKVYNIKLGCIICGAPAKAFITNIKNHTGYFGCTKCICEGDYLERRVVFLSTNSTLRTNESFRNRENPEHHKGPTILEELNIDMIKQLPIDYMHLVLLGITKRVLSFWIKGNISVRLKKEKIDLLNEMYLLTNKYVPSNFERRPRSIADVERWKASEFRLFLLYVGPIIMKNILDEKKYKHFLSLVIGIRLLSCKHQSNENINYANQLLVYYFKKFGIFFGKEYCTYNIHNLIHLSEDVRIHGNLDSFSAFKYENYMFKLKQLLKTSRYPLQQINNRIMEETRIQKKTKPDNYPLITRKNGKISRVQTQNLLLSLKPNDNCVLLDNDQIVLIEKFEFINSSVICTGRYYLNTEQFFKSPCNSTVIGIYAIKQRDLSESDISFNIGSVLKKCFRVPYLEDVNVIVTLLH